MLLVVSPTSWRVPEPVSRWAKRHGYRVRCALDGHAFANTPGQSRAREPMSCAATIADFFSRRVIDCRRQHTTDAYHLRAAACLAYCLLGGRPKDDMIKKSPPSDPLTKNKGNDDALDGLKVSTSGSSMPNSLRHPCGGIQAFRFDNTYVLCAVRTLKCNRDL